MENLLRNRHGIRSGIFKKSDGQLIDTCGFHKSDKVSQRAEIGYELGSPHWRQSYMTELFPFLLTYSFEIIQLNRIEAPVMKANFKSIKLLKKFGFKKTDI